MALTCENRVESTRKDPGECATTPGAWPDWLESNMTTLLDLTGHRYGCLTVTGRAGTGRHKQVLWACRCVCGTEKAVASANLRNGKTWSCGCKGQTDLQRFQSKTAAGDNGCLVWTAQCNRLGYGQFWFRGTNIGAHRAAWLLQVGEIPDGLFVCHRCDNPPCVNVAHLFLGTALDNMLDKVRKGRGRNQYQGATHCKRGHPRVPAEIQCLACRRVTAEIRRANGGKW